MRDQRLHGIHLGACCKTTIGRGHIQRVGHQRHLLWSKVRRGKALYNLHQIVVRIALDVELTVGVLAHQRGDWLHVTGADVPLVRARMHGDAISTGVEHDARAGDQIRQAVVAAVAQQRDAIDVGREMSHGR